MRCMTLFEQLYLSQPFLSRMISNFHIDFSDWTYGRSAGAGLAVQPLRRVLWPLALTRWVLGRGQWLKDAERNRGSMFKPRHFWNDCCVSSEDMLTIFNLDVNTFWSVLRVRVRRVRWCFSSGTFDFEPSGLTWTTTLSKDGMVYGASPQIAGRMIIDDSWF